MATKQPIDPEAETILSKITFPRALYEQVQDYRFANRIETFPDAVRVLIRAALAQQPRKR